MNSRQLRPGKRLKRPVIPLLRADREGVRVRHRPRACRQQSVRGPRRPLGDPLRKGRDLTVGQLLVRRHPRLELVADRLHEKAFLRLPRHNRRPALAPFREPFAAGQVEPPLDLLSPVTTLAPLNKNRPDLRLEKNLSLTLVAPTAA